MDSWGSRRLGLGTRLLTTTSCLVSIWVGRVPTWRQCMAMHAGGAWLLLLAKRQHARCQLTMQGV